MLLPCEALQHPHGQGALACVPPALTAHTVPSASLPGSLKFSLLTPSTLPFPSHSLLKIWHIFHRENTSLQIWTCTSSLPHRSASVCSPGCCPLSWVMLQPPMGWGQPSSLGWVISAPKEGQSLHHLPHSFALLNFAVAIFPLLLHYQFSYLRNHSH